MAAMVLGTALSAIAPTTGYTAPASEVGAATVHDLQRYCAACWRNARLQTDAWPDCTQEVLKRLLERVALRKWEKVLGDDGEERREFFRAIDAVKKRTQRLRRFCPAPAEGIADARTTVERQRAEKRAAVDQASAELLSPRQQRILQLTFDGWSVAEIAEKLQISVERVSDEKYKSVKKLREHLADIEG